MNRSGENRYCVWLKGYFYMVHAYGATFEEAMKRQGWKRRDIKHWELDTPEKAHARQEMLNDCRRHGLLAID